MRQRSGEHSGRGTAATREPRDSRQGSFSNLPRIWLRAEIEAAVRERLLSSDERVIEATGLTAAFDTMLGRLRW